MPEDFALAEGPLPEPQEGEVLLRGIYLSLDPYMRGRISGLRSYARPTGIGEVIEGRVVGQVVRSRDPTFRDGDYASGGYGWQLYSAVPAGGLLKLDPAEAPISTALGVLGMPGMTAYIGLSDIGQPKAGETVVVSAASGAVGAVAGQLAKRAGARVVGIAGGAEKCRYVESGTRLRCGDRPSGRSRRRSSIAPAPTASMFISRMSAARCRRRCFRASTISPAWSCAA